MDNDSSFRSVGSRQGSPQQDEKNGNVNEEQPGKNFWLMLILYLGKLSVCNHIFQVDLALKNTKNINLFLGG